MTAYLLHLHSPFKHARHYIGYTGYLPQRLAHHAAGTGANMLKYVVGEGGGWTLARVWYGADRSDERRLKGYGGRARLCPLCMVLTGRAVTTGNGTGLRLVRKPRRCVHCGHAARFERTWGEGWRGVCRLHAHLLVARDCGAPAAHIEALYRSEL